MNRQLVPGRIVKYTTYMGEQHVGIVLKVHNDSCVDLRDLEFNQIQSSVIRFWNNEGETQESKFQFPPEW